MVELVDRIPHMKHETDSVQDFLNISAFSFLNSVTLGSSSRERLLTKNKADHQIFASRLNLCVRKRSESLPRGLKTVENVNGLVREDVKKHAHTKTDRLHVMHTCCTCEAHVSSCSSIG